MWGSKPPPLVSLRPSLTAILLLVCPLIKSCQHGMPLGRLCNGQRRQRPPPFAASFGDTLSLRIDGVKKIRSIRVTLHE
jgi:hypothetical protein